MRPRSTWWMMALIWALWVAIAFVVFACLWWLASGAL